MGHVSDRRSISANDGLVNKRLSPDTENQPSTFAHCSFVNAVLVNGCASPIRCAHMATALNVTPSSVVVLLARSLGRSLELYM